MASKSWRVVKLVAIGGTIPAAGIAIGYRTRSLQASEKSSSGEGRIYRGCDLPLYEVRQKFSTEESKEPYPRNIVEEKIGVVRQSVQDVVAIFQDSFGKVKDKVDIGVEHTKASLDYIQNNPGELPRVGFITVAGMGGFVLGFRGGLVRKLFYATIAATSCAALCYPKYTVALSEQLAEEVKAYWAEYSPIATKNTEKRKKSDPALEMKPCEPEGIDPSVKKRLEQLRGDPGQSKPEDKDMYSNKG